VPANPNGALAAIPRCPYYRAAEDGLYGSLWGVSDWDTQYFDALGNSTAPCAADVSAFPAQYVEAFVAAGLAPLCGEYFRLTSQFPYRGPCYAVWAETVDYVNRSASPQVGKARLPGVDRLGSAWHSQ
jgi:solute carrier family 44 (choline transporter-like protein), member 2/4/5